MYMPHKLIILNDEKVSKVPYNIGVFCSSELEEIYLLLKAITPKAHLPAIP